MPEQQPQPQEESPFPNVWTFVQTNAGTVVLSITMPQGLVPFLKFMNPGRLLLFQDDVNKAVKKFVPLGMRQAMDIVSKGWINMPEPDEPMQDAGVVA